METKGFMNISRNDREIIKLSLVSRLVVFLIQYVSNILIPDHDAQAFTYLENEQLSLADKAVKHLFGGFIRWDAHYFMHIAKYGYTFENTLVFYPAYPLSARLISRYVSGVLPFLNIDSVLLIVFLIINVTFFIFAALNLYKLSLVFFSPDFALRAVKLFIFNPASIFFTAPYTECMFAWVTFKSMLGCVDLYKSLVQSNFDSFIFIKSIFPIALTIGIRSNGILNLGFFVYSIICLIVQNKLSSFRAILRYISVIALGMGLSLIPLLLFSYHSYNLFCSSTPQYFSSGIEEQAAANNYVLAGGNLKGAWCNNSIPLSYSYIQEKYWNVGFLRYYTVKKIPNFLLALPVIGIALIYCMQFIRKHFTLNIENIFNFDNKWKVKSVYEKVLLVYVVHIFSLTIFCVFFVHIEVSTRMLFSASPCLYWICASVCPNLSNRRESVEVLMFRRGSKLEIFIAYYFLIYFGVGIVLFCNFLPWT